MAHASEPVLILTGAPGSGKTTVAGLLAQAAARAVHLRSDCFFHFIASGYVEPWKTESHVQNTTVMRIVGQAATEYAGAGYYTIIDGIVSPRWFLEPLRGSLAASGFQVAYAVLRPPLEVAIERARSRSPDRLPQAAVIEQLWRDFADLGALEPHAIDNGALSAEETCELVARRLHAGTLTT